MSVALENPSQTFALIVGVEQYEGQDGMSLPGCAVAARSFRDWLIECGVPAGQILTHIAPPASGESPPKRQAILDALKPVHAKNLVVYWASHGYSDPSGVRGVYFADSFPSLQTWDVESLLGWLSGSEFATDTVFAIFDCCANPLDKEYQLPPAKFPSIKRETNVYAHFACDVGETAGYTPQRGGNFSAILSQELSGRSWPLDLDEFDQALDGKFQALAKKGQRPIRHFTTTPSGTGERNYAGSGGVRPSRDWRAWLGGFFPAYEKKYRQHFTANQAIDLKGLTTRGPFDFELDAIYVEPALKPVALQQMSSSPVREAQRQGLRTIWDYLESPALAQQSLVIVGGPGTGKTTILRRTALALAGPRHRRPVLPVFLSLSRDVRGNTNRWLPEVICDHLESFKLKPPPGWLERRLRKGHFIILLDAFDEIGRHTERTQVADWMSRQRGAYTNTRFIVTSRPYGYRENPLQNVATLEVQPFTEEQVRNFVQNWYTASEVKSQGVDNDGVRQKASAQAASLLRELNATASLAELAVNPLMLTMLAEVHNYSGALPMRRAELYAEVCRVFLGGRARAADALMPLDQEKTQTILEQIAWRMMEQEERQIKHTDVLSLIEPALRDMHPAVTPDRFLLASHQRGGIFLKTSLDQHGFAHFSLQEYLAAMHAQNQRLSGELLRHIQDPWWRQTLIFFSALGNASMVITECLREANLSVASLTLAVQWLDEASQMDAQLRDRSKRYVINGSMTLPQIGERPRLK